MPTIKVLDSAEFDLQTTTLQTLYDFGSRGKDTKGSQIDRATGFLQRLAQVQAWAAADRIKCKEYINSLIKGSNLLDSFVCVPEHLLVKTVNERIDTTTHEVQKAWIAVKEYIEKRVANGAKRFIIDGQNRLFEAIIPFFDNEFPLGGTSLVISVDGETVDVKGRYFKDKEVEDENGKIRVVKGLSPEIQDYIYNIEIPFVDATKGDLEQFCDTLIWKNEGVAWDEVQKMVMKNWFTKFLHQVREISDKDNANPIITKLLGKIAGKDYQYEVNGYDRLVAELLIWMVTGTQIVNPDMTKQFFEGHPLVETSKIESLKTYLLEFAAAYDNTNYTDTKKSYGIVNIELRNYVYLRYVLDHRRSDQAKGITVPNWSLANGKAVEFAAIYKKVNSLLISAPEKLGQLPNQNQVKVDGRIHTSKNAGSYVAVNSKKDKESIKGRIEILFSVLDGRVPETRQYKTDMINRNVVVTKATDKSPSRAEIHHNSPFLPDGKPVSTLDYDDTDLYDVGHITPKSHGGSNEDVVLQKKRENRQLKDKPLSVVYNKKRS